MRRKTLGEHSNMHNIVIFLYATVTPVIFVATEILETFVREDNNWWLIALLCVFSGFASYVVYVVTKYLYRLVWRLSNKDIYIGGKWIHVHTMDDCDSYLRVGLVDIKQDFYDLEMDGENFNVSLVDGKPTISQDNISTWEYIYGNIDKSRNITGLYFSPKSLRQKVEGVHKLKVGKDHIIRGNFVDFAYRVSEEGASVDRVGCITLYKPCSRGVGKRLFSIVGDSGDSELFERMPRECYDTIVKRLGKAQR